MKSIHRLFLIFPFLWGSNPFQVDTSSIKFNHSSPRWIASNQVASAAQSEYALTRHQWLPATMRKRGSSISKRLCKLKCLRCPKWALFIFNFTGAVSHLHLRATTSCERNFLLSQAKSSGSSAFVFLGKLWSWHPWNSPLAWERAWEGRWCWPGEEWWVLD